MSTISRLMRIARENVDENIDVNADGVDMTIDPAEAETALADTDLAVDMAEDRAEFTQFDNDLGQVEQLEVDAQALGNSADLLEESLADDGNGADPVAAEIVSDQIEAAVERWSLPPPKTSHPAKESFNTTSGQRAATRSFVSMAREAEGSMTARIKAAVEEAIKWFKELLAKVFDKKTRLVNRAKALNGQLAAAPFGRTGSQILADGKFLGETADPAACAAALKDLPGQMNTLANTVEGGQAAEDVELNPSKLGGASITITWSGGKAKLDRTPIEGEPKPVLGIAKPAASSILASVITALDKIKDMQASFDKAAKANLSYKDAVTQADNAREAASGVGVIRAYTGAASALVQAVLHTSEKLVTVVEKSMAGTEKVKAEPVN